MTTEQKIAELEKQLMLTTNELIDMQILAVEAANGIRSANKRLGEVSDFLIDINELLGHGENILQPWKAAMNFSHISTKDQLKIRNLIDKVSTNTSLAYNHIHSFDTKIANMYYKQKPMIELDTHYCY